MTENPKVWNVLWSYHQNALHAETMELTIKEGMEALRENRETQYVLVATGLTKEEADAFCEHWHDVLHVRQIEQNARGT